MSDHLPTYDLDLFSEQGIRDPHPHYRRIRDLGSVVWLSRPGIHAVTRYADVRAVLADNETFVSGEGVLFSDIANQLTRGTTLASDEPEHAHLRGVVAHRLTPRALREERAKIEQTAADLVDRVLQASATQVSVDAVPALAQAMPMSVVPDFIGFPPECHDQLIGWASGAIEAGGPPSERTAAAAATAQELGQYAGKITAGRDLVAGSLGADLLVAAAEGRIEDSQCPALLLDYFGPSLETTISAIGSALALFAQHPAQWELLRADPGRVAGAFNEVVRLESPLRAFTRVAAVDAQIGDATVAAGTRIAVFFASANRDERRWDRPDEFDILRDNADHVGLGYGVHGCAGQGLARLEFGSLLTQLAARVSHLELVAEPTRTVNSLLRAWSALPMRLHAATPA